MSIAGDRRAQADIVAGKEGVALHGRVDGRDLAGGELVAANGVAALLRGGDGREEKG